MAKKNPFEGIVRTLADPNLPIQHRSDILRALASDTSDQAVEAIKMVIARLGEATNESRYRDLIAKYEQVLKALEEGPFRHATFIEFLDKVSAPFCEGQVTTSLAKIIFEDGTTAYPLVPDPKVASSLRCGDRVLVDGRGKAILRRVAGTPETGEEGIFERRIDAKHVEATVRGQERAVFVVSDDLLEKIQSGEVGPGATLLVNTRQYVAFRALAKADGFAHFKYLVRTPVPDITVEKHIGAPPRFIQEIIRKLEIAMTNPRLLERYKIRSCTMQLLSGVSGSGKTLAVLAFQRAMYELMSRITGVPIAELPPRVFRLNISEVLSPWVGQSDQNLDRFFDEPEKLAREPWKAPNGKEYWLPQLVIVEEMDGLFRARGRDSIYDRILTNALVRLDPTRPELKDKLIVYIGTTNEPQNIDRAALRRIGGNIETFGRLNRKSFVAVLGKHLAGLPLVSNNGYSQGQLREHLQAALTDWFFAKNGGEVGLVELTYSGTAQPVVRFRRDFLTGAVVDRAVQQAAHDAAFAECNGTSVGVSLEALMRSFTDQIKAISEQLTEQNAHHYLDVPSGSRVALVRRITQPRHLPIELQRH